MVTFGFIATSAESHRARKISVMKNTFAERSKMELRGVLTDSSFCSCFSGNRAMDRLAVKRCAERRPVTARVRNIAREVWLLNYAAADFHRGQRGKGSGRKAKTARK